MELGGMFPKLNQGEAESNALFQPEAEKVKESVPDAFHCLVGCW